MKLLFKIVISSCLLFANTPALNKSAKFPINFDEEGLTVAITEVVNTPHMVTYKYSNGSVVEICPRSIEAFARNDMSIYQVIVRDSKATLHTHPETPQEHLDLIEAWAKTRFTSFSVVNGVPVARSVVKSDAESE